MSSLANKKEGGTNKILYVTINGTRYYYPLNMNNAKDSASGENGTGQAQCDLHQTSLSNIK